MKRSHEISAMYKNLTLIVHLKKYLIPQRPAYPTNIALQYTNLIRSENPGLGMKSEELKKIMKQKLD